MSLTMRREREMELMGAPGLAGRFAVALARRAGDQATAAIRARRPEEAYAFARIAGRLADQAIRYLGDAAVEVHSRARRRRSA